MERWSRPVLVSSLGRGVMMGSWPFQGAPQACRVREEPTKEAGLGQTEGEWGCKPALALLAHMDRGKQGAELGLAMCLLIWMQAGMWPYRVGD